MRPTYSTMHTMHVLIECIYIFSVHYCSESLIKITIYVLAISYLGYFIVVAHSLRKGKEVAKLLEDWLELKLCSSTPGSHRESTVGDLLNSVGTFFLSTIWIATQLILIMSSGGTGRDMLNNVILPVSCSVVPATE